MTLRPAEAKDGGSSHAGRGTTVGRDAEKGGGCPDAAATAEAKTRRGHHLGAAIRESCQQDRQSTLVGDSAEAPQRCGAQVCVGGGREPFERRAPARIGESPERDHRREPRFGADVRLCGPRRALGRHVAASLRQEGHARERGRRIGVAEHADELDGSAIGRLLRIGDQLEQRAQSLPAQPGTSLVGGRVTIQRRDQSSENGDERSASGRRVLPDEPVREAPFEPG